MSMRIAALAAAVACGLALAGCETATPFQPLQRGTAISGGYSDQQIEDNRFQITFEGNSATPRATVETYLLYRAAQVTVEHGFDWFEMVSRSTDADVSTWVTGTSPVWGAGWWAPSWRWGGPGGWGAWGSYSVTNSVSFQAMAEILTFKGPRPASHPRAFDARQVLTFVGPRVIRPAPRK